MRIFDSHCCWLAADSYGGGFSEETWVVWRTRVSTQGSPVEHKKSTWCILSWSTTTSHDMFIYASGRVTLTADAQDEELCTASASGTAARNSKSGLEHVLNAHVRASILDPRVIFGLPRTPAQGIFARRLLIYLFTPSVLISHPNTDHGQH